MSCGCASHGAARAAAVSSDELLGAALPQAARVAGLTSGLLLRSESGLDRSAPPHAPPPRA
jgi:hypothetical protein